MTSTIAGLIREHGRHRSAARALTAAGRSTTFGELDARSSQVAQALAADGVGPGDRVALLAKNVPECFELLFGAAKLGAVYVPVSWRLAPPEVAAIVGDAGASVLVVAEDHGPVLDRIRDDLAGVKRVVVVGDHAEHPSYDDWAGGHPPVDPGHEAAAGDVVMQLYTSGTTGVPKGVMLTEANLHSLAVTGASLGLDETSVNLVAMPLFHIGGIGYGLIGMSSGCHTVLLREVDPAAMLREVVDHGVTNLFAVPAVLQALLATPGVDDVDFSSLRAITYGASPISVDVLSRSMATFGCRFVQVYGLTETTGTVVLLPPEDHIAEGTNHRLRSAGRAVPGAELRIVAPGADEAAAVGEVGEIWVRSPQNTPGYWNKPEETARSLTPDGWLLTGDAGYLDADGYLYLHDRVKDMIVSGGENVYPAEVENVLMSHPGVADVGVIGVPSDRWGETVKAIVVKAPGADVDPAALIAFARERLAAYKCPTSVDFADALPRNPSGKILKRELRAPFWAGRDRAVN
jgi:long-chain acyl-CoA synthetase